METWQQKLFGLINQGEERFDDLKQALGHRLGHERPVIILPYMGYGKDGVVRVQGRVLANPGDLEAQSDASVWENLWDMYQRAESDEIPYAELDVLVDGKKVTLASDGEGFFRGEIVVSWHSLAETVMRPIHFILADGSQPEASGVAARADVLIPGTDAHFGVISDIDDTVLQSHATEPLRMLRTMLSGNARTRLSFAGVTEFYRALQAKINPIFYVSSSPWNLYDLLEDFLALQDLPSGPMLLRDWGLTRTGFLPTDHREHKLQAIGEILDFYPSLPFVLIGDNGQQDPEIYGEIASRYPGRILAVFIREVDNAAEREAEVMQVVAGLLAQNIPSASGATTMKLAQVAAATGLLDAEALPEIAAAQEAAREQE